MFDRISIVTDEISQDLAACDAFLSREDLHLLEVRCVGGRRVPDLAPADLEVLQRWVREKPRKVLAVSPGLFKCRRDDPEAIRRHLDDVLPRSLEVAARLEAPFLITFTFENPDGGAVDGQAVDALGAAADACAAAGITLLLENEPGFLASTPDEILALVRAVEHPNLFVNWDPLNANVFDTEALEAGLTRIFPHVRHVHVKNGRLRPGERLARGCRLRDGAIDWHAHLDRLRWLGYTGGLGVETHFEPLEESSALVLAELREMVADVGFDRVGN